MCRDNRRDAPCSTDVVSNRELSPLTRYLREPAPSSSRNRIGASESSRPRDAPRCCRSSSRSSSSHGRNRSPSRTSAPVAAIRRHTMARESSAQIETIPGVGSQPHSHSSSIDVITPEVFPALCSGNPSRECCRRLSLFCHGHFGRSTDVDNGDDPLAVAHARSCARRRITHHAARLDVRPKTKLDGRERNILHGHHRRRVILFANLRVVAVDDGHGDHQRKCAVLLRNGLTHFARSIRILELTRLAIAERESVSVSCLWTQNVKPPRLRESVVRRERCGLEKRFDFFSRHRAFGKSLNRATLSDGFQCFHALEASDYLL